MGTRIDEARLFNQEGAKYLSVGDVPRAVSMLCQALRLIQDIVSMELSETTQSTPLFPVHEHHFTLSFQGLAHLPARTMTWDGNKHSTCGLDNDEVGFCYTYNNALYTLPRHTDSRVPEAQQEPVHSDAMTVETACIVLNLGLAYHLQAIRCDQDNQQSSFSLERASALYSLVEDLLVDAGHLDLTALFLRSVAMNNFSQIQIEQGNFGRAREALAKLAILAMSGSLIMTHCHGEFLEPHNDTWTGFLMNAACLPALDNAPAA